MDRVRDLYARGLFVQAFRHGERQAPLREWEDTSARVLAGRLAHQLGAPRLANALHLSAWRTDREHPAALYFAATTIARRRGVLAAWDFLRGHVVPEGAPDEIRANVIALRAQLLSGFRDFSAAEQHLSQAREYAPESPWLRVCQAQILHHEDRFAEALDAALAALDLRPHYVPAVLTATEALLSLGRDDQAIRLLTEANRNTEAASLRWSLAALLIEHQDADLALANLEQYERLTPLREDVPSRALAAFRSQARYLRGDIDEAAALARQSGEPSLQTIAERLETRPRPGRRVQLPVEYVRQRHRTCAPAVLTSISRFWSREASQIEIAEEICYDGTPAHSERDWAERNDWLVREFTVSWDSAVSLVDRGIPFTLTTAGPVDGHLQAIIGYDTLRGTFLVRDPGSRNVVEMLATEMLDSARATGPRGMAMVPRAQAERLESTNLPDTELWDQAHAAHLALDDHDRAEANRFYQSMSAREPGQILTLRVRRALAAYDRDAVGLLGVADSMLKRFPDDPGSQFTKVGLLLEMGRDNEAIEFLGEVRAGSKCHVVLLEALAGQLIRDARQHDEARRLLRVLFRNGVFSPGSVGILAELEHRTGRVDRAIELYRFAATLDEKNEARSQEYFNVAWQHNRAEEAQALLSDRAERYGSRSPWPIATLGESYRLTGRSGLYVECLERALRRHPEDHGFVLHVALAFDRMGLVEQADGLLARTEGEAKRRDWLITSAEIAGRRGELRRSLDLWEQTLSISPTTPLINERVVRLLESLEGPRSAYSHLESVCRRFPRNAALQTLRVDWMLDHDWPDTEQALRALIDESSVAVWPRLRLAHLLGKRGELDEAFAEVEIAALLDPADPAPPYTRGVLLTLDGRPREADGAFRDALRRSVMHEPAIHRLFSVCSSDDAKRDALEFLGAEIVRQLNAGAAPRLYRSHARAVVEDDELLASLDSMWSARPDHAAVWSALIGQLIAMGDRDRAWTLTVEYLERFPLDVEVCLDVAELHRLLGIRNGERKALDRALALDPTLGPAHRALADLLEREGHAQEARDTLERAIATNPLDSPNHVVLARLLWNHGACDRALDHLERAVLLDPENGDAWVSLRNRTADHRQPDRIVNVARKLAEHRPGETSGWLRLAHTLDEGHVDERLDAVDRALALDPRCIEAHDCRAMTLAEAGRFDEAMQACAPEPWRKSPPTILRGRAAWIHAVSGDIPRAAAELSKLLDSNPDYAWGWQVLGSCYRQVRDVEGYAAVARRLTELDPTNPAYLLTAADASILAEDYRQAENCFARALELVPDDLEAAFGLFDLQLHFDELEDAGRTLDLIRPGVNDATFLALRTRLAAVRGDYAQAFSGLAQLIRSKDADEWQLERATDSLSFRWPMKTNEVLAEAVYDPGSHPFFGEKWVRACVEGGHWSACRRWLESLDCDHELARRSMRTWLDLLGKRGQGRRLLRFVRANMDALRQDNATWAKALWSLADVACWRTAVALGRGWRERPDLEPSMLIQLAFSHRALGKLEEAFRIHLAAEALPADASTPRHRAWLAVDEAIRGHREAAERYLAGTPDEPQQATDRFLAQLARVVLTAGDPATLAEAGGTRGALSLLEAVRAEMPTFRSRPAFRRTYARAVRCMRRNCRLLGLRDWWRRSFRA